jgi:hypothetical protein
MPISARERYWLQNSSSERSQRIPYVAPGVETADERQGLEAFVAKRERHTGAGGLVQSGTVDGDQPLNIELGMSTLDLDGTHSQGLPLASIPAPPGNLRL